MWLPEQREYLERIILSTPAARDWQTLKRMREELPRKRIIYQIAQAYMIERILKKCEDSPRIASNPRLAYAIGTYICFCAQDKQVPEP